MLLCALLLFAPADFRDEYKPGEPSALRDPGPVASWPVGIGAAVGTTAGLLASVPVAAYGLFALASQTNVGNGAILGGIIIAFIGLFVSVVLFEGPLAQDALAFAPVVGAGALGIVTSGVVGTAVLANTEE